jgi:hypothetical protein
MKGTLISADFIKDASGNFRILELNTDTGFISNTISSRFDFSDFTTILSNNTITELVVIYKIFQAEFISALETHITDNASFITTFTKQVEDTETIYPSAVTDASDKFILRLAYDENALLDSTYCKERANLQKLFYDNSATGSIPEFWYSGSNYEVNTLTSDVNGHDILPDFVAKTKVEQHTSLDFIKVGNEDSSSADRISDLIGNFNELTDGAKTIEKYHYHPSDITDNGKVSGFRKVGIVYGTDIEFVSIGGWRVESFFSLPTSDDLDYLDSSNLISLYDKKHYFELTSNWLRTTTNDAVYEDSVIIKADNSESSAKDIVEDDLLKSMYIEGLPDTDDAEVYRAWSASGSTLPSGSYVTSSIVENSSNLIGDDYGVIGEIKLANDERIYTTITKHFLTYSTGSNEYRFLQQFNLDKDDHFLVDSGDNKIQIVDNNVAILESTETGSFYRIDIEDTDSFFISSSQNAFIVHNAPCFVAGTKIHTENGIKNIEDVKVGEKVMSFNHDNDTSEYKEVLEVMFKENECVITYVFEDETELTGTKDHPLYVVGKGYSSFEPQQTLDDSGLNVEQIEVGDVAKLFVEGEEYPHLLITEIKEAGFADVYNLKNIQDNHNFYANNLLVHNRACCFAAGTQISLSNGDTKSIENVVIGDNVAGWDSEKGEKTQGSVSAINHKDTVGSHAAACSSLGNEPSLYTVRILGSNDTIIETGIEFTPEHPFLTKEGWKSLVPDNAQEPYLSEQEPKTLVVGDEINVDDSWVEIKSIDVVRSDADERVYNFTVDGIHSYIANGIIVHNK